MSINDPKKGTDRLGIVLINLMKGILYVQSDPGLWQDLVELAPRVRDYLSTIGLELVMDEAEGYAFLRQRPSLEGDPELPRIIPRRKLGYLVSLLLVLLRKKLAENDAAGHDTRLIIKRQEIVEMIRLFLPDTVNEVRLSDQIDGQINRIVEMGFIRKLRGDENAFEVRRVLKSFVDAQWLDDFQLKLAEYATGSIESVQEEST